MIKVSDLHYCYPNNAEDTLQGLCFSIPQGDIFGFLGPSGSGKSTTQKIIYKLLRGYSGQVSFMGKDLNQWSRDFYRKIGVSFELPNLYSRLTAAENMRFFAAFYADKNIDVIALLEKVGLAADANKMVGDFSKGMKMRLNFVRAIMHDPDMLFLDEPTAGLDPVNANIIKTIIRDLKGEGKTIFLTTHNMFDADQLCDQVALLHQGKIKALDSPTNLKRQYGTDTLEVNIEGRNEPHVFPLDNIGNNTVFLEVLKSGQVSTMHSQEASLEEVFIKITGDRLL